MSHSHSLGTCPEQSTGAQHALLDLGLHFKQPNKHRLTWEVQTTFPPPSKPCNHAHIWHESQDKLLPLCLANFTSYFKGTVCTPYGGLLPHRGEEEDVFPPLPIQTQTASMRTVVYSTLSASYLGSLSFRKRNWGQNVPKLFKNKTQDWLLAQPLLLCQLSSTLTFEIFIVITLLRFSVFNFLIRVHSVEFSEGVYPGSHFTKGGVD